MLGFLFLLVALLLYSSPKYRHLSYFMYVSMMLGYGGGGLGLWTDMVLGVKNMDLALMYTFCINGSLLIQRKFWFPPKVWWVKSYKILLFFLVGCVLFSYFYYKFTPYQILQGGRSFLLLFSLPILIRVTKLEFQRVVELLLWVTIVTSILYILQIVVGRPLMPYNGESSVDSATGLVRLYNRPPLLQFFLLASFVCPRFFPGNIYIYRSLFFVALMCTLGRTFIFTTIFAILIAVIFMGRKTKLVKAVIVLGMLFVPFVDMISQRFEKGDTSEDVRNSISGGYKEYQSGDGTMSYRLAWVYERGEYLLHRPLGEQIFGMGLISGSQDIVYKMYHFELGLTDENGEISQLGTPDISYGNLLTKLGFWGGAIYLVFVVSLMTLFFRHRKEIPILTICATQLVVIFITAFSGSGMSTPSTFTMFFLSLSLLYSQSPSSLIRGERSCYLFLPYHKDQKAFY